MSQKNRIEMRMFVDIEAFHTKFELPSFDSPSKLPADLIEFREKFLQEEAKETYEALAKRNHPEALDGFIDLAYVALGTFYLQGGRLEYVGNYKPRYHFGLVDLLRIANGHMRLDRGLGDHANMLDIVFGCRKMAQQLGFFFDTGWDRVQEANMSKVRTKREGDSKRSSSWDVVKPEGWVAPKMEDLV